MAGGFVVPLVLGLGLFGGAAALSWQLDKQHHAGPLRYAVPRLDVVQAMATGFGNLLADGFWLQFLQYNGEKLLEAENSRTYENLWEGFSLITGLDPHFKDAYMFGSWVLGDDGQFDHAEALIRRGAALHPDEPRYLYQLGFVQFLYKHDLVAAIASFRACSRLAERDAKNASLQLGATRMAAGLALRRNEKEAAANAWRFLHGKAKQAGDARMADIAKRALGRLGFEVPD